MWLHINFLVMTNYWRPGRFLPNSRNIPRSMAHLSQKPVHIPYSERRVASISQMKSGTRPEADAAAIETKQVVELGA
jgi:hypothetical protein